MPIVALVAVLVAAQQGSDFSVPTTVSVEAQDVLRSFSRADRDALTLPSPNDLEGWGKVQGVVEAEGRATTAVWKEIFLSGFVRMYQALDAAGQTVKLDLYEGMWHAFQRLHPDLPESRLARTKSAAFLKEHLGN